MRDEMTRKSEDKKTSVSTDRVLKNLVVKQMDPVFVTLHRNGAGVYEPTIRRITIAGL